MLLKKIIILCSIPFLVACKELQKGEKVGQIIDLKQSGFFVKTWECKLIRGGLEDGSGTLGASMQLTIEDKGLVDKANEMMKAKKFVVIKYHQEAVTFFRSDRASEDYFIDSIEELNNDR